MLKQLFSIFLVFIFVSGFAVSEEKLVAEKYMAVYEQPSSKSEKLDVVNTGTEFNVIGKFAHYYKIEIIDSKGTSVEDGDIVIITSRVLGDYDILKSEGKILEPGANAYDNMNDRNKLGVVLAGSEYKIVDSYMNWHLIKYQNKGQANREGWVYAGSS